MTLDFRIGALLRRNLLDVVAWRTNEIALSLTLGIGTVLSRLPFRSTLLNSHDAVNYALALHRFDLRLHQPQPPGYPLYILIGRIFKLVFQDDLAALLWVSMVFSGLAVIAMYLVGRDMYNRRTGFICALLAATSSLVWYQSEVAAPYTADLFASAIVGWLCYRALIAPGRRIALLSALALGLAGALRLQTFILLFPLFLFSLRLHPWKTILGASLMAGLMLAIFLAPTIWLSGGGLLSFLDLTFGTVRIFRSSEALAGSVSGLRYVNNLFTVLRYAVFALGELVVLFIPLGYLAHAERWRFWKNSRVLFLVLWTLPTWLLFMLIGTPNRGATLLGTSALFVLGSLGIDWLMRHLRLRFSRPARRAGFDRWGWALGAAALTSILVWNIAVFTVLPRYSLGESYRYFDSYEAIASQDNYFRTKLALVRELPSDGTVIYAQDFRVLQYYAPQYHIFSAPLWSQKDSGLIEFVISIEEGKMTYVQNLNAGAFVPAGTQRIIFFDLPPELLLAEEAFVENRSENGHQIQVMSIPENYQAVWTPEGLSLQPQS